MAVSPDLFRPQAIAALDAEGTYKDALKVMRPGLWGAGLLLVAIIIGGLVWSAFFSIPVTVNGQGIFLSSAGVADVVANAGGQVHELAVSPGDFVEPDMVVARISQPDVELELAVAQGRLADAEQFRDELTRFQSQDLESRDAARTTRSASLENRIAALTERRDALIAQRNDLDGLVGSGVITRDRLMGLNQDILVINSQISEAADELSSLASTAAIETTASERERLDADRAVTEAQRQVTTLTEQLARMGVVRSPFGGRVVETKVNVGSMVQPGTPVLTIERQEANGAPSTPVVIAYVGAADGKKITPGMSVEVSPSTTRREEHGFIRGTVTAVSDVPASSAGMLRTLQNDRLVQTFIQSMGAPFEVTIALQTDAEDPNRLLWSSPRPNPPDVDSGTMAEIRVTTRTTPLLALAIPALRYAGGDARIESR
jgi:HlyD family secretion protein